MKAKQFGGREMSETGWQDFDGEDGEVDVEMILGSTLSNTPRVVFEKAHNHRIRS